MGKIRTDFYRGLYDELAVITKSKYPNLQLHEEKGLLFLTGILPLIDPENNEIIDWYKIEIEYPRDYPSSIPIVREIGGRIPRSMNRHINPDGSVCLGIEEQLYNHISRASRAVSFIEGPISQFFLGQTYYELTKKWIFGEWSHGVEGIVEFYSELLKTKDPKKILTFIYYLSKDTVNGHWSCYCTNGKRLKNCHMKFLLLARSTIPVHIAKESHSRLLYLLKA